MKTCLFAIVIATASVGWSQSADAFEIKGNMFGLTGAPLNTAELAKTGETKVTIRAVNGNNVILKQVDSSDGTYNLKVVTTADNIPADNEIITLEFVRLNQVTRRIDGLYANSGTAQLLDVTVPAAQCICYQSRRHCRR